LEDIELGKLLKKARQEKGLTINDIQERTKIRKKYLEAIEANDFDVLPGKVYLKVFIKGYAREVDINYQELLNYYPILNIKKEHKSPIHKDYLDGTKVTHRSKNNKGRKKSLFKIIFIVIVSLFLIAAAVYTFQYFVNSEIRLLNQNVNDEQNIEENSVILENDSDNNKQNPENNKTEAEMEAELADLNNENDILDSIDSEILSDQNTEVINPNNFNAMEGINSAEGDKITEIIVSNNLMEEQNIAEDTLTNINEDNNQQIDVNENLEINETLTMNDADEKPVNSSEITESNEAETQISEIDKTINFIASDTVWVNIRLDGETAFSGILEAGDSRDFEINNELYIKIGKAEAIKAVVNGKERGPWSGLAEVAEVEFTVEDNEIKINNLREDN